MKNEAQSQLEYFSALEANTEGFDNVGDEDNNDSDYEIYVEDYLKYDGNWIVILVMVS